MGLESIVDDLCIIERTCLAAYIITGAAYISDTSLRAAHLLSVCAALIQLRNTSYDGRSSLLTSRMYAVATRISMFLFLQYVQILICMCKKEKIALDN